VQSCKASSDHPRISHKSQIFLITVTCSYASPGYQVLLLYQVGDRGCNERLHPARLPRHKPTITQSLLSLSMPAGGVRWAVGGHAPESRRQTASPAGPVVFKSTGLL
jgi:hypothetical protein